MKFSIHKAHLFKALSHVQSVVEKRNTIPILSNVLVTVTEDALSLTATDLDIEIVETVDAITQEVGSVTAPAHMLYEIIRKLPESALIDFSFNAEEGRVYITAGKIMFNLPCLPREDFPLMNTEEEGTNFNIPAADLKRILDKSKFAISNEETRYYLSGVFLHYEPPVGEEETGCVIGVATDGHRLARIKAPAPQGSETAPAVIIPRKTVTELRKLIEDSKVEINVTVSDAKIRFSFDNILLTSKLIDGSFPDYKSVIPADNNNIVTVPAKSFIDAADRVATVSSDKVRVIRVNVGEGKIGFYVENADLGFAREEIECEYAGDALEIGFNARYLIDVASQTDSADIILKFGTSNSPVILQNKDDSSALYILMPMRI